MTERKTVILVGSIPPPFHGSSIYFNNLLNSKMKDEFDITHLDISDHRDLDNLSKLDLTNVTLALKSILNLHKMLKTVKPDLVYIPVASNFLPYLRDGLFILTSAYFSKAKIVIHLHEGNYFRNEFYDKSNFLLKRFIKRTLSKTDTAIVLGDRLISIFDGLVKNVVAVPNGINRESTSVIKDRFNSDREKIIIGFLGNLFESKGVLDILNAAEIVLKKYDNVEFRFAGAWSLKEGNTKHKAERIIAEKNLGNRVFFSGVITGPDKEEFLNKTDIFVFPTWYKYEGFGIVIIEAMAEGLPVISTKDTGTIPDIVTDGETGILIGKQDSVQIADAIIKLIENPLLRKTMGEKGKLRYEKYFTLDTNINKMIAVFNKVLN
ncbi:MAG: glycosyltransferase family 4 protein [Ignavibacteria bacterium]|nr:glycosyltransferase family 4 protein [Ignavibacteria bacterium]